MKRVLIPSLALLLGSVAAAQSDPAPGPGWKKLPPTAAERSAGMETRWAKGSQDTFHLVYRIHGPPAAGSDYPHLLDDMKKQHEHSGFQALTDTEERCGAGRATRIVSHLEQGGKTTEMIELFAPAGKGIVYSVYMRRLPQPPDPEAQRFVRLICQSA